jgi:hypothetical protein
VIGAPGTILVSASGEVLSLGGYRFPPVTPGDLAYVDGWDLSFDRLIVTIDKVTLWESPDTAPGDQSRVGKKVAELDGPWAIDLHKGGLLAGKGGTGEQAVPFATFLNQNYNGNAPFDPTVRYAFGYDLAKADASALIVNLDAAGLQAYQQMIADGATVQYAGTATWKGSDATCMTTDSSFTGFSSLPKTVDFRLAFQTPTSYVNCLNPDISGAGINGEDHPRGVQIQANSQIVAQITLHTDHPMWESYDSDGPPIHFDQLAAVAKRQPDNRYLVTLAETVGEDYTAFPVPWRWCSAPNLTPPYMPPDMLKRMDFKAGKLYMPSLPAPSSTYFRDYYDLMLHQQSTQGHLNSNGLCVVQRHFVSPP